MNNSSAKTYRFIRVVIFLIILILVTAAIWWREAHGLTEFECSLRGKTLRKLDVPGFNSYCADPNKQDEKTL